MSITPKDLVLESFKFIDSNNDNSLSKEELIGFMKTIGETPSSEDIGNMIKKVDSNGDGRISFDEYKNVILPIITKGLSDGDIGNFFNYVSDSKGEYIDDSKITKFISILKLDKFNINVFYALADTNKDYKISLDEFINYVKKLVKVELIFEK